MQVGIEFGRFCRIIHLCSSVLVVHFSEPLTSWSDSDRTERLVEYFSRGERRKTVRLLNTCDIESDSTNIIVPQSYRSTLNLKLVLNEFAIGGLAIGWGLFAKIGVINLKFFPSSTQNCMQSFENFFFEVQIVFVY